MTHHDEGAELAGYRNELGRARDDGHAADVREEIERVSASIKRKAASYEERADALMAEGQDVAAAQARVHARALRASVGDAPENAADTTPHDSAVPRPHKGR